MTGQTATGMQIGPDLLLLLPQLAAVATGVLALIAEMLRRPRWARLVTIGGLLVAAALALPLVGRDNAVFLGTYRVDGLSTWAALVLLPATALVVPLAAQDVRGTDREGTVYALLALTTVGALVLAGAGDVLFVVLGRVYGVILLPFAMFVWFMFVRPFQRRRFHRQLAELPKWELKPE